MSDVASKPCEGFRITGRACDVPTTGRADLVNAQALDAVEGWTREILPLMKRTPVCGDCIAAAVKHWPFEFFIEFFTAPTTCEHTNAEPKPRVGLRQSSYCPDCRAVFRVGNGTYAGNDGDFLPGDELREGRDE